MLVRKIELAHMLGMLVHKKELVRMLVHMLEHMCFG
jgi:hypothetical protein